jgi:hypothetical protein
MADKFPAELSIRDAVVRESDSGFILAGDPELEADDIPHTNVFRWKAGAFTSGPLNFNAKTCCFAHRPRLALVMLDGRGNFGITTKDDKLAGNIFQGTPDRKDYGAFEVVTAIEGKAHAAGSAGMVYRLDDIVKWVPIDKGVPEDFDISAIDGFNGSDIYAVGYAGAAWHFVDGAWSELDLPTNVNLTAVKCAGDGKVYIAGFDGLLIRGRSTSWEIIAQDETTETIWDLEWFEKELYVSTMLYVYRLKDGELELVDFGDDTPQSCYHLSAAEGVMWSIGAEDIMSFDGKTWTRVV